VVGFSSVNSRLFLDSFEYVYYEDPNDEDDILEIHEYSSILTDNSREININLPTGDVTSFNIQTVDAEIGALIELSNRGELRYYNADLSPQVMPSFNGQTYYAFTADVPPSSRQYRYCRGGPASYPSMSSFITTVSAPILLFGFSGEQPYLVAAQSNANGDGSSTFSDLSRVTAPELSAGFLNNSVELFLVPYGATGSLRAFVNTNFGDGGGQSCDYNLTSPPIL